MWSGRQNNRSKYFWKCTKHKEGIKENLILNGRTWQAALRSGPEVLLRLIQGETGEHAVALQAAPHSTGRSDGPSSNLPGDSRADSKGFFPF